MEISKNNKKVLDTRLNILNDSKKVESFFVIDWPFFYVYFSLNEL